MPSVPSTQDLELGAHVLKVLVRRGTHSFTLSDFAGAGRARASAGIQDLLDFLTACGLLDRAGPVWSLSRRGHHVVEALARSEWGPYAESLVGSGFFEDELVRIIEAADEVGEALRLPLATASRLAPLAGRLLMWEPHHRAGGNLVLPLRTLEGMLLRSGMEQAAEVPDWVLSQNTVGWRAELYSLRLERSIHGAKRVLHVSRDIGDGFGYDIESSAVQPPRLIEVKGSRSSRVSFVISKKELEVARRHPQTYEIQFWGEIDLSRLPSEEYVDLRTRRYPVVIQDPASSIETGGWSMEPRSWQVRRIS